MIFLIHDNIAKGTVTFQVSLYPLQLHYSKVKDENIFPV
jgi:hypothetical protein